MTKKGVLSLAAILFVFSGYVLSAQKLIMPVPLTYYTEIYPPSSFYKDEQLTGISVEVIKAIWQDLGLRERQVYVVPWARGYKEVSTKMRTVLFATSKTKARAPLFKWVGPIFSVDYLLIARKGVRKPVHSLSFLYDSSVVVIRDDITADVLAETDFPASRVVAASHMEQAVEMFNNQRVELLAISNSGLANAIKQGLIDEQAINQVFLLKTVKDYFAFSNDVPDQVVEAFQNSLERIAPKHQQLKAKYNLL